MTQRDADLSGPSGVTDADADLLETIKQAVVTDLADEAWRLVRLQRSGSTDGRGGAYGRAGQHQHTGEQSSRDAWSGRDLTIGDRAYRALRGSASQPGGGTPKTSMANPSHSEATIRRWAPWVYGKIFRDTSALLEALKPSEILVGASYEQYAQDPFGESFEHETEEEFAHDEAHPEQQEQPQAAITPDSENGDDDFGSIRLPQLT